MQGKVTSAGENGVRTSSPVTVGMSLAFFENVQRLFTKSNPTSVATAGFSLLELMAVVFIIGIFSALAIPGIMEIRYRNELADSVERIRSAGAATRDLAMQTRQAAVLEVTSSGVWVNLLDGSSCDDGIAKRCTTNLGRASDGFILLYDDDSLGRQAGTAMCGGVALSPDSSADDACTQTPALVRADGFALCYSGIGELFYRLGADAGTLCDATGTPATDAAWQRSCSTQTAASVSFADGSTYAAEDGAVLLLNRYDDTPCASETDALDTRRLVVFPTDGAPFSQIGGTEGAANADTD